MSHIAIPGLRRSAKITALFAVLAPAIGGLPIVVFFNLASKSALELSAFVGSFFFAYLFGLLPASLAGVLSSFLSADLSDRKWCWYSALIGFLVSSAFGFFLSYNPNDLVPIRNELLQGSIGFGLPGILGGGLAACVVRKLGVGMQPKEI
jgi:hypothetical protein